MLGYAGNDVIYGGEGNDILIGGTGNDTLIGGENDDTYIIKYGEGTDTIIDTQGRNKVIYKDIDGKERIIDNFYTSSSGSVITADGKATLTHNSPWQIVFDDGTAIELGEGCTPENFGTTLVTLPTTPGIENTILGDLTPVDMDPDTVGFQFGYDEWGNLIVDPSQPDPGREDYIYDTFGNDLIEGGGGDDVIYTVRGGDDRIKCGEGNDILAYPTSFSGTRQVLNNSIIEGGAGSDIIIGGWNGNNQLFGGNRGDGDLETIMATHIAEGETAPDSGVRGDIVGADGENNNYLFGLLRLPAPHFSLLHDREASVAIQ